MTSVAAKAAPLLVREAGFDLRTTAIQPRGHVTVALGGDQ